CIRCSADVCKPAAGAGCRYLPLISVCSVTTCQCSAIINNCRITASTECCGCRCGNCITCNSVLNCNLNHITIIRSITLTRCQFSCVQSCLCNCAWIIRCIGCSTDVCKPAAGAGCRHLPLISIGAASACWCSAIINNCRITACAECCRCRGCNC